MGWRPLLRRRDQSVVAAGTLLLWLFVVANWFWRGGHRGELVDIDRAELRPARFQLDINQADWPEFALLPGIGETRARRIVELRETAGPFRTHEGLLRVKGIGPKTLERIRPFLLPAAGARHALR